MSYKPDPFSINQEANLQRTDVPRIMKANFDFKEDKDLLKLLQRMELATIKQAERESPIEIAWRGTIEAYGKKQPFLIEHLFPAKGGFRGSMVYDDKFFALTGEFLPTEDETNDHLPFELEAFHERTFAYRLKGRFVGYDIELRMERISKTFSIPLTMRLTCKSTPCTVFMEPYKSLYPGRAKISDLLYVVFYNNGKLNLISGKLNSLGVFVGQLIRDGMVGEPPILRQTKNPKRTGKALAVTLLDEKNQIGYVIEMHPNK